jgi:hypothetical protein
MQASTGSTVPSARRSLDAGLVATRAKNTRSLYEARVLAVQGQGAYHSRALKSGGSQRFSLKLFAEKTAALSPLRLPAVDKPPTIAYGLRELPPSRMTAAPSMPCAPMDALGVLAPVAVVDHFRVAARAAFGLRESRPQALALVR